MGNVWTSYGTFKSFVLQYFAHNVDCDNFEGMGYYRFYVRGVSNDMTLQRGVYRDRPRLHGHDNYGHFKPSIL